MKPLPAVVVTKLKTAAAQPQNRRLKAIDESVKWARQHFPEFFMEAMAEEMPVQKTPTLEKWLSSLQNQLRLKEAIK